MSDSASPVAAGRTQSPADIRFYTQSFHALKGWCYAPAGALLALATPVVALLRPGWLINPLAAVGLVVGAVLVTTPWIYVMHRRYRAAYGHIRQSEDHFGTPLSGSPSLMAWMVYMVGMMSWLAVVLAYIPHTLGFPDNHYLFFFAALPLANGAVYAPSVRPRVVYGGAIALLVAATLSPFLNWPVLLVQTICYTTLGLVVMGVGLFNHRLLVDAFGPREVEDDG